MRISPVRTTGFVRKGKIAPLLEERLPVFRRRETGEEPYPGGIMRRIRYRRRGGEQRLGSARMRGGRQ